MKKHILKDGQTIFCNTLLFDFGQMESLWMALKEKRNYRDINCCPHLVRGKKYNAHIFVILFKCFDQVVSDKQLVKHLQKEVARLEAVLRTPDPSNEKDQKIQQVHYHLGLGINSQFFLRIQLILNVLLQF